LDIPRIIRRTRILFSFVLRLKTFQTGPGFQQCPVHGEVLVRSLALLPCLLDHPHLKFLGYFGLQQAVSDLLDDLLSSSGVK
jgi:hypothetical protein